MIFLTLVLQPAAARWSNVILAILYVVTIVGAAIRRVRLLLVPERRRDRDAGADRSVRVDVAPRDGRDDRSIGARSGLAASRRGRKVTVGAR